MEPGGPDLGQPTNFFPRRNRFAFQVHVPKDFGTKEIVWTLTSKGRTEKTYGTLKPDYVLDDTSIMSNIGTGGGLSTTPDMVGNKAPALKVDGPKSRTAKVGEPRATRRGRDRRWETEPEGHAGAARRQLHAAGIGQRPASVFLRLSRSWVRR